MSDLRQPLRALSPEVLAGLRRGIEKESLRVRPDGTLATTPHPPRLGSALNHRSAVSLIANCHWAGF